MAVHCSPCFEPKEGDIVTVGQCRPLSKTVRFNVLKVEKNQIFGNPRKVFMLSEAAATGEEERGGRRGFLVEGLAQR
eukprot:CAMPEP_0115419174 /NCGR_PEP_ID=MMETSP0271-20121206/25053_1 /TAXON_ID=71861 /ORGANISM="Scrippsiella trochoidea, Strain CCMP3099" /LENGTH=76 /DNA_ID=CAMNT_0002843683 /DNA_START=69 /DNA_END=296 /DNA_ORIENTATION=-